MVFKRNWLKKGVLRPNVKIMEIKEKKHYMKDKSQTLWQLLKSVR